MEDNYKKLIQWKTKQYSKILAEFPSKNLSLRFVSVCLKEGSSHLTTHQHEIQFFPLDLNSNNQSGSENLVPFSFSALL